MNLKLTAGTRCLATLLLALLAPALAAADHEPSPAAVFAARMDDLAVLDRTLASLESRRSVPDLFGQFGVPTPHNSACERAALTAREADLVAARADFLLELGKCISAEGSFWRCVRELRTEYEENLRFAMQVYRARLDVCRRLDEDTYAPEINPRHFSPNVDNCYFPLVIGRRLIYRANNGERTRFTALAETFEVEGVECRIIRDIVSEGDATIEDTDDWYAQHRNGDVWYLGEIARNFEDDVLHDLHGSWRFGEDGALPGILMKARPRVGDVYRQEFLFGEAEDLAVVVAVNETVTVPAGTFTRCLKTEDWTPLEPGVTESKWYAPGVGFVLGVNNTTGERTELVRIVEPD